MGNNEKIVISILIIFLLLFCIILISRVFEATTNYGYDYICNYGNPEIIAFIP